jgi:hypothetical protein
VFPCETSSHFLSQIMRLGMQLANQEDEKRSFPIEGFVNRQLCSQTTRLSLTCLFSASFWANSPRPRVRIRCLTATLSAGIPRRAPSRLKAAHCCGEIEERHCSLIIGASESTLSVPAVNIESGTTRAGFSTSILPERPQERKRFCRLQLRGERSRQAAGGTYRSSFTPQHLGHAIAQRDGGSSRAAIAPVMSECPTDEPAVLLILVLLLFPPPRGEGRGPQETHRPWLQSHGPNNRQHGGPGCRGSG